MREIAALQLDVVTWADQALPGRKEPQAWMKLFEELGEVIKEPNDPLEWADVFIMLLDLANMHQIDIEQAISAKLRKIRGANWQVNSVGVFRRMNKSAYEQGVADGKVFDYTNHFPQGSEEEKDYDRGYHNAAGESHD